MLKIFPCFPSHWLSHYNGPQNLSQLPLCSYLLYIPISSEGTGLLTVPRKHPACSCSGPFHLLVFMPDLFFQQVSTWLIHHVHQVKIQAHLLTEIFHDLSLRLTPVADIPTVPFCLNFPWHLSPSNFAFTFYLIYFVYCLSPYTQNIVSRVRILSIALFPEFNIAQGMR